MITKGIVPFAELVDELAQTEKGRQWWREQLPTMDAVIIARPYIAGHIWQRYVLDHAEGVAYLWSSFPSPRFDRDLEDR